ncbi:UDP-4-amino-4,6-dideoxy-N-acetyl-beta-L-altrosamine transaminase [Gemmatimonas sp. UBA7669]|uniref:UDP-4-amino-4, 6-dideoxy-N-acetyl-beta-L-altrosamine transaminase n=1 Tax=Gemmatimonas sp. UBA7669 TaxID=1946568 RepID=UPI0025BDECA0|nr:UDP-4-amino-4,6-dideoxy-N-acetyl-beta-L-altrosamine transaminase [Gemmatimonas sp. UBA7669]
MDDDSIPYGRHEVDADDLAAVAAVLQGDWLTTGPAVERFERAFAEFVGVDHAVAVSSGTAALHLAMLAGGIGPGDEVIVPTLTFAATANCVRYVGGTVVFADIDGHTLTVDPDHVASLITPRTRAIVAVDYAGLPADLTALRTMADRHGLLFVEDGCHALGAWCDGRRVGSVADLTCFSFHPVKHITTAEGGMITTANPEMAALLRTLRNHGIPTDHRARERAGVWEYDMTALGYNYRLSDLQCALGFSQLAKLPAWLARRATLAARYDEAFAEDPRVFRQSAATGRTHAHHLYPLRVAGREPADMRAAVFHALRQRGVRVNVHYRPVYLHSYYQALGYRAGLCPVAEHAYAGLLSLPMWHGLRDVQQAQVIDRVRDALTSVLHAGV